MLGTEIKICIKDGEGGVHKMLLDDNSHHPTSCSMLVREDGNDSRRTSRADGNLFPSLLYIRAYIYKMKDLFENNNKGIIM